MFYCLLYVLSILFLFFDFVQRFGQLCCDNKFDFVQRFGQLCCDNKSAI